MKRFIIFCVALMLLGTNLMAQNAPVRVSLKSFYNQFIRISYPKIYITSVEDNLIIKNVIVNKGHCTLLNGRPIKNMFPTKLQYSQNVDIPLSPSCHVIRIDIVTNKDTWTVEY